ncbi:unnamed protein product [Darwinula stevensoni]|uniref:Fibrinogen C-terminal domain-containing protein n=1 Tax=Darwinula stevensoni TaxID=69355 RepID=A0A7R8X6H5_9CRUS|nr:unnamed protein product [Darwinula stevensoni]CAG0882129.1 unnamed protein product [Darwinula stevensoni]
MEVIQRRRDFGEPRQNFTLSWDDYKKGFGDLEREFWFGNDFVHRMTSEEPYVLRVDLADFEGNRAYAQYSVFIVGSGEEGYPLKVEGYEGNGTDSLSAHSGSKFSTWDRDNDDAPECCPCAPAYGGGWWFYSCFESNLNGQFFPDPTENGYYQGIIWEHWKGDYSLASSEMKIRPKWFHSLMESGAFADAPADGDTATTTPWWVGLGISPVPDP